MLNEDFEYDPTITVNPLYITEASLDRVPEDVEALNAQRKALREKWAKSKPYNHIDINYDSVVKNYIQSEGVEEDFSVPLDQAPKTVLGVTHIPLEFEYREAELATFPVVPLVVDQNKIQDAVTSLLAYAKKKVSEEMIPQNHWISLLFTTRAANDVNQDFHIGMTNPLVVGPSCLIVVENEAKKKEFKTKLANHLKDVKISVGSKFFLRFKSYKEQYKLFNSYDFFFHDEFFETDEIARSFGNHFHNHPEKLPTRTSVDTFLVDQKRVYNGSFVHIPRGEKTFRIHVGRTEWTAPQILKNIGDVVSTISKHVDSTKIKKIMIKESKSPALVLYVQELKAKTKTFKCEAKWKQAGGKRVSIIKAPKKKPTAERNPRAKRKLDKKKMNADLLVLSKRKNIPKLNNKVKGVAESITKQIAKLQKKPVVKK